MAERVLIIGAGPSGLTAAKACLEVGLVPVVLEKAQSIGGLWRRAKTAEKCNRRSEQSGIDDVSGSFSDPLASVWPSLRTNLSNHTCSFSDFLWKANSPDFPQAYQVLEYLTAYSERFGLTPHIRYGVTVERLELLGPQATAKFGVWTSKSSKSTSTSGRSAAVAKKAEVKKIWPPNSDDDEDNAVFRNFGNVAGSEGSASASCKNDGEHNVVGRNGANQKMMLDSVSACTAQHNNHHNPSCHNQEQQFDQERHRPPDDVFNYCMVCAGIFSQPVVPAIPGLDQFQEAGGQVMHVGAYAAATSQSDGKTRGGEKADGARSSIGGDNSSIDSGVGGSAGQLRHLFGGKKVVVVGAAFSGCDIASEIGTTSTAAKECISSVGDRKHWIIQRYLVPSTSSRPPSPATAQSPPAPPPSLLPPPGPSSIPELGAIPLDLALYSRAAHARNKAAAAALAAASDPAIPDETDHQNLTDVQIGEEGKEVRSNIDDDGSGQEREKRERRLNGGEVKRGKKYRAINEQLQILAGGIQPGDLSEYLQIPVDDNSRPPFVAISDTYLKNVQQGNIIVVPKLRAIKGRMCCFEQRSVEEIQSGGVHGGDVGALAAVHATEAMPRPRPPPSRAGPSPSTQFFSPDRSCSPYMEKKDIDVIIFCTGFKTTLDWLPAAVKEQLQYDSTDLLQPLLLHHQTLHSAFPTLAFIGVYRGPYFAVMELQARWAARVWAGLIAEPNRREEEESIKQALTIRNMHPRDRPQFPCNYVEMADALARAAGVTPPGGWGGSAADSTAAADDDDVYDSDKDDIVKAATATINNDPKKNSDDVSDDDGVVDDVTRQLLWNGPLLPCHFRLSKCETKDTRLQACDTLLTVNRRYFNFNPQRFADVNTSTSD